MQPPVSSISILVKGRKKKNLLNSLDIILVMVMNGESFDLERKIALIMYIEQGM